MPAWKRATSRYAVARLAPHTTAAAAGEEPSNTSRTSLQRASQEWRIKSTLDKGKKGFTGVFTAY